MTPLQVAKAALEALLNRDWYDHGAVIAARNEIRAALARIAELEAQPPAADASPDRTRPANASENAPKTNASPAAEPAKVAVHVETGYPPDMPCVRCGAKREDPKWNICAACYGVPAQDLDSAHALCLRTVQANQAKSKEPSKCNE